MTVQVYNIVVTTPFNQTSGVDAAGQPIVTLLTPGTVLSTLIWDGVTPLQPLVNTEFVLMDPQP